MVKHGRNKRRRAGRIGKTKIKSKGNFKRWDPDLLKKIKDPVVAAHWDPSKSFTANFAAIGLVGNPNDDMRNTNPSSRKNNEQSVVGVSVVELFDIPDSDEMGQNQKKRPMTEDDQKYIVKCLSKHGNDYARAFRDIETNYMQHTETKLRKLGARFLLLSPEERLVDVPDKVKLLIASDS